MLGRDGRGASTYTHNRSLTILALGRERSKGRMDKDDVITLLPYNKQKTCPKCGGDWITSKYCHWMHYGAEFNIEQRIMGASAPRHLDRQCQDCDYGWLEQTKDSKVG